MCNVSQNSDIAIIGIACRFPDAQNVREFWENLCAEKSSITSFSSEELLQNGLDASILSKKHFVNAGAYVSDIDKFDAEFFGYNDAEAALLDPQIRLFLESSWEAMENAGIDIANEKVGVYVAVPSVNLYLEENLHFRESLPCYESFEKLMFNCGSRFATKVAYHLDLKGPAVAIQTACSSSLCAIIQACQSLSLGDCSAAIVGGVSIRPRQKTGYLYSPHAIFSADGKCRAFDEHATGTVFGNGLGVVVLKPLHTALQDGDQVIAVIKGYAINNDGYEKINYAAPSIEGQSRVVSAALENAGITPESITYVEMHGTGTLLGDAVEVAALQKAYNKFTREKNFCAIGSVKTNIGHLGVAAGMAGIIKTSLSLQNKKIPASLNFSSSNVAINFANSPFYVNDKTTAWKHDETMPRRAGVSAFGVGGTNAHIILEEATSIECNNQEGVWNLFCFSAKTVEALDNVINNFAQFLVDSDNVSLGNIAYTLQVGRQHFRYRAFVVANNLKNLRNIICRRDLVYSTTSFVNQLDSIAEIDFSHDIERDAASWKKIGDVWVSGLRVDFKKLYCSGQRNKEPLPTYPFRDRRYWISSDGSDMLSKRVGLSGADVTREVLLICQDILDVSVITVDDNLVDLGVDSIGILQLASSINQRFCLSLTLETIAGFHQVKDIVDCLIVSGSGEVRDNI
ncbi:MAG: hypothetical protein KAS93_05545 [Gammaproteobacteria bacterium]|nr:hypothetical protein [Gammaproteobacteria bacterium]